MSITSIGEALSLIIILLVSLSFHEFAHSAVAYLYGDPTAKNAGRMTINPIAHWDPVGTTLLVGLIFVRALGLGLPIFGWGKPVPVNESNLENIPFHGLLISIAGPLSNFVLAVTLALIYRYVSLSPFIASIVSTGIYLNIFLMLFNLLPVPPLDGSSILRFILPEEYYITIFRNPTVYIIFLFIILFFVLDYVGILASHLYSVLLGIPSI